MDEIVHIFLHCFEDTLEILPFLFATYLVMEWAEHKAGDRIEGFVSRTGRAGPLIGALVGLAPQCGFSAASAGLYSGGLLSAGTLMAVFLATSDEMIAVLFSSGIPIKSILIILGVKFAIAVLAGYLVDAVWKVSRPRHNFESHCEHEGCHCEERGIFKSALFHTVKIFVFVFVVSLAVHSVVELAGEDTLGKLFSGIPVLSNIIAALIGLIPNCAASVVLTQLYVEGILSAGAMISGLLVGAGTGLLVLFRVNGRVKDNLKFLGLLYLIGVIGGILTDFVNLEALL